MNDPAIYYPTGPETMPIRYWPLAVPMFQQLGIDPANIPRFAPPAVPGGEGLPAWQRGSGIYQAGLSPGLHPTAGAAFTSVNGSPWIIDSVRVCSNNHYCIVSDAHAHLLLRNVNFGACGLGHMIAEYGGFIETLAGPYTISGGAPYHITALMQGE